MTETYSIAEIANRVNQAFGLSDLPMVTRLVRYWASEGLLRQTGPLQRGRGRDRVFDRQELLRAGIIHELSTFHVTANAMKFIMSELDAEIASRDLKDLFELVEIWPLTGFRFLGQRRGEVYILLGTNRRPTPARVRSDVNIYAQIVKQDLGL